MRDVWDVSKRPKTPLKRPNADGRTMQSRRASRASSEGAERASRKPWPRPRCSRPLSRIDRRDIRIHAKKYQLPLDGDDVYASDCFGQFATHAGILFRATDVSEQDHPIALGIDLRLTTREEGGRKSELRPFSMSFQYRPNWGFQGLDLPREQVGSPVLSWSQDRVEPGDRVRAVIVPMFPASWTTVDVGTKLTMYEGPRVCGHATVVWRSTTIWPVPKEEYLRFDRWTKTGMPDPGTGI